MGWAIAAFSLAGISNAMAGLGCSQDYFAPIRDGLPLALLIPGHIVGIARWSRAALFWQSPA
jgi:hypothetical protein